MNLDFDPAKLFGKLIACAFCGGVYFIVLAGLLSFINHFTTKPFDEIGLGAWLFLCLVAWCQSDDSAQS